MEMDDDEMEKVVEGDEDMPALDDEDSGDDPEDSDDDAAIGDDSRYAMEKGDEDMVRLRELRLEEKPWLDDQE